MVWITLHNETEASSNPQSHSTSNWRNASCNWTVNHRNRILLCFNALSLIFLAQGINHTRTPMALAAFVHSRSGFLQHFCKPSNGLGVNVLKILFVTKPNVIHEILQFCLFHNFWGTLYKNVDHKTEQFCKNLTSRKGLAFRETLFLSEAIYFCFRRQKWEQCAVAILF